MARKRCRHYRSVAVKELPDGWLKCLDCGKLRNIYHPNQRVPEYRTGPVTDQTNQGK